MSASLAPSKTGVAIDMPDLRCSARRDDAVVVEIDDGLVVGEERT